MLKRFSALDVWTLVFILAVFGTGTWKAMSRTEVAGFETVTRQPTISLVAGEPGRELSPDGNFRFDAQFVSAKPGQAVHAASLIELNSGDLRAFWFSGTREGAGDVTVQTALFDTTAGHWGKESQVVDRLELQRGLQRYVKKIGNPVVGRAADGSLLLWMVTVSIGGWAGSSISWMRSTDEGLSWSQPRRLVTSPFLNISTLPKGAPLRMKGGAVALPVYHEFFSKFAELLHLDTAGNVVDKIRIPGSQTNLQPVVIPSSANEAQLYMRSGRATEMKMSNSGDGGKTWSASRATAWSNPDSALAGASTQGSTQWLAINPGRQNRAQLALVQTQLGGSFDGQSMWRVEASDAPVSQELRLSQSQFEQRLQSELLAAGVSNGQADAYVESAVRQLCNQRLCSREYSYPYLLEARDGSLHMVYTWHRTRIKHVRLDPSQQAFKSVSKP